MFWQKLGILISDLYLYGIKTQTNIKQNSVEKYSGKSQIFRNVCFLDWAEPNPTILMWAGPAQLCGLGQNWPSHEQWLSTIHMLREQWRVNYNSLSTVP